MAFDTHLFLSDVHLGAFPGPANEKIEKDLLALIAHCKSEKIELHILGDLFDYWMEYPDKNFIPSFGKKVLDAFEDYNRTVTPALFVTGNHDNWTFGHFEERGFDLEQNFRLKEIDQKRFLLMHGDGVASSKIDFPRAAFHRLLRNPKFVSTFQKVLSPEKGLAVMKGFSSLTRRKSNHNPQPLNRQAKKIFARHELDFIITGHDHLPRVETFSRGSYINSGAFYENRTVSLYTKGELKLVEWKASVKNFLPFDGNRQAL